MHYQISDNRLHGNCFKNTENSWVFPVVNGAIILKRRHNYFKIQAFERYKSFMIKR